MRGVRGHAAILHGLIRLVVERENSQTIKILQCLRNTRLGNQIKEFGRKHSGLCINFDAGFGRLISIFSNLKVNVQMFRWEQNNIYEIDEMV